ncbi:MAG: PAS domain S-box protein [Dethiobacteria bacterium]
MVEKGKYRLLLECLPDAFAYHQILLDGQGRPVDYLFLEVNPAFEAIMGLPKDQVLGRKVTEIYPGTESSSFDWIGTFGRVAAGHGSTRFEHYFEPTDCWYGVTAYSDTPGYFAAVFRDITEEKRFQNTLREKGENLYATLDSIGDGVITTDLQGKIKRMNPQAEKLTGWAREEAAGRPLEEVFHIIDAQTGNPAPSPVHHVLATEEIVKLANDTTLVARDGKRFQIADSAAPVRDSRGNISGAIMVFSDVTEQYEIKKELKETTRRLKHILRATQTGVDIIDKNFNLVFVDDHWQDIYGSPQGRKCYEYFKDRHDPCENCGVPEALETKQVMLSEQILPKEGDRVVACQIVPFQNEEGDWLAAEFKTDITRRKKLEDRLKHQLQFEKMVSSISGSFVETGAGKIDEMISQALRLVGKFFDMDRGLIYQLSPAGETMDLLYEWCAAGVGSLTGISRGFPVSAFPWLYAQIQRAVPLRISDVQELPKEAQAERKVYTYQGIKSVLILPFYTKTGAFANSYLAFDSVREKKSLTDEEVGLLSIVADTISSALTRQRLEKERQKALETLKASEENLAVTLHSIGDGVIATDEHGRITRLNPRAEKLTGWPEGEAQGLPLEEVFHIIDAKTGAPASNPAHQVLRVGEIIRLANDTTLIARDGQRYQIADSAAPIHDSAGKVIGVVIVFSDVTEQYRAREVLRESELRYRTIVENNNDALFIRDFAGKILDLNERACQMLGYSRDELLGANLDKIRSPEEKKLTRERTARLMESDQLLFEGTMLHRDGFIIPIEASIKVVSRKGDGLIQSFVRDITERKESERRIARYTSELEGLYRKLDEEINKARQVHERTLPRTFPTVEGLSFAAHVTGHGVDGAILSVFVKHTIKGYLSFAQEKDILPGKILRYLSTQFRQKNLSEEYFICVFLASLDLETMELTYTAAGFQDAPLVRLGNGGRLRLTSKGLFLSPAFSEELLNLQEKKIRLTPGTTIFFNTDGLTEQGAHGVYYGTRLPDVFYEHSHLPPQLIAEIVREDFRKFNGGSLQGSDDITFLVLQLDPRYKKTKRLELASDFAELTHLREQVSRILGDYKEADLFLTCLHELASNAIEHGNQLDPQKKVFVELVITDRFAQASVEDQGDGFHWQGQIDKPLELDGLSERGRGIAMTQICSGRLFYNDKGNRATFII